VVFHAHHACKQALNRFQEREGGTMGEMVVNIPEGAIGAGNYPRHYLRQYDKGQLQG